VFLNNAIKKGYECYTYTLGEYRHTYAIIDSIESDILQTDTFGELFKRRLYLESFVDFPHRNGKDLRNLNIDLKRTIAIDNRTSSYVLQPENVYPVRQYTGAPYDYELYDLLAFIDTIDIEKDIRPFLINTRY
jgi:TFIIF-interacting CTD phosphatase-like protein